VIFGSPVRRPGQLDDVVDAAAPVSVLGRSHTARSALRGGVAVALRCVDGSLASVRNVLEGVRAATVPAAVGPVDGALLGAVHGAEALPVDLVGSVGTVLVRRHARP
jgi:hypothetical protein